MVLGFKGQSHRVNKCIFHANEHNSKTNDPKMFNLVKGMTLGYPDMVLGFQGHKLGLGLRQRQYGVGLNSMSAFWFYTIYLVLQVKSSLASHRDSEGCSDLGFCSH